MRLAVLPHLNDPTKEGEWLMDHVWESQLFASLAELIESVNDRSLTADRFKVIAEPSHSGSAMFHLLYLTGAEPDPLLATAVVDVGETSDLDRAEERVEAVDEAESIIRDNRHG